MSFAHGLRGRNFSWAPWKVVYWPLSIVAFIVYTIIMAIGGVDAFQATSPLLSWLVTDITWEQTFYAFLILMVGIEAKKASSLTQGIFIDLYMGAIVVVVGFVQLNEFAFTSNPIYTLWLLASVIEFSLSVFVVIRVAFVDVNL